MPTTTPPFPANAIADSTLEQLAAARAHYGVDYYGQSRFQKYVPYFDRPGTVLDFGCGEGVFLNVLRDNDRFGLGIDYDREAARTANGYGLDVRNADIFEFTSTPQYRERFAGVMLADFVEHFDPHVLQRLLRQTIQVLEPDAPMVIITPNSHSIMMNMGGFYESTIEHHNLYAIAALEKFLNSIGMVTVAKGVDEDSRLRVIEGSPSNWVRSFAMWTLGRLLCGRDCMYECGYLVVRKDAELADAATRRYADSTHD